MSYDIESVLIDIRDILQANLPTYITAINTEKNDGITCDQIDNAAYFMQSLNIETINYNPFLFYSVQNIETITPYPSMTSQKIDVLIAICASGENEDVTLIRKMFRYQRALKDCIEQNFKMIGFDVNLSVSSLVPAELQLMDTSYLHRVVGLMLTVNIA